MTIQDPPINQRSNEIKDSEIPKYVGELKNFLGSDALAKAQAELDKDLTHHGLCYSKWAQELQPWLFAFRKYDQETKNGIHIPNIWPREIREMAGEALMISALQWNMPKDVSAKYRKDLLTVQHNDFIFEIHTAWHYYLKGYDVQWYPLGHTKCPEFRVQGRNLDFDVECRRFGKDMNEGVKMAAIADTCDIIYKEILSKNLWGEVNVEFADDFRFDPGHTRQWSQVLDLNLEASPKAFQLDSGIRLAMNLISSQSRLYTPEELVALANDQQHPERTVLRSKRKGNLGFDPVIMRCSGPRKTPKQLRDYIYKTLKEKITTQLSQDRAGIIVGRFNGIRDPHVFDKSQGMKDALAKLFERQHLAAIILQCDGVATAHPGSILYSTPSILFRNPGTAFPQVAAANHLSE